MMESLIQRASELNLGCCASYTLSSTKTGRPDVRQGGSEASGQYRVTSGAIRSDDDFSSIGYSSEGPTAERIVAPPRAFDDPSCSSCTTSPKMPHWKLTVRVARHLPL